MSDNHEKVTFEPLARSVESLVAQEMQDVPFERIAPRTHMVGPGMHGAIEGISEDGVNEGSDELERLPPTEGKTAAKIIFVGTPSVGLVLGGLMMYNWFRIGVLTADGLTTGGMVMLGFTAATVIANFIINQWYKPKRRSKKASSKRGRK